MHFGTFGLYNFKLLSVTLTLAEGHKVSRKHSLFGSADQDEI